MDEHPNARDATNGSAGQGLASMILRDFFDAVRRGVGTEGAPRVIDAWIDGDALAVTYESPWWEGRRLGLRRAWPPHYMNNDPATTGIGVWTELTEPLGKAAAFLRDDSNGVGWWGDPPLPTRPSLADDRGPSM